MTKLLIDASGLHSGGGVQVAASFLDELARFVKLGDEIATWPQKISVEISTAVSEEIARETRKLLSPRITNRRPSQLGRWLPRSPRFDVSFVIFGPEYGWARAKRRIVGFADCTSIMPRPNFLPTLRGRARIHALVRKLVSRRLHAHADVLVVETQSVADTLVRQYKIASPRIEVVPNTANGIFATPDKWTAVADPLLLHSKTVKICYVARAYEHKNHRILANVARHAEVNYNCSLSFVVTLNPSEWNALGSDGKRGLTNVGPLHVSQVPTLLKACDAVIFPSLLEVYSASPVEAMLMGKLLFASDRAFVRESCGAAPVYFDPTSAKDMSRVIVETLANAPLAAEHIRTGRQVAAGLLTPADRARRYLEIMRAQAHFIADR